MSGAVRRQWRQAVFLAAVAIALASVSVSPAFAVTPDEMLKDPALEKRARTISAELRCLVCQNQSIDDSNAELAKDLRVLVRDRLSKGDSDGEVIDYLVSRYGEFVLLRPRFETKTLFLWGTPIVLLLAGAAAMAAGARRRPKVAGAAAATLTRDEEAALQKILQQREP